MKKILPYAFLLVTAAANGQSSIPVLQKVAAALRNTGHISYRYKREMRYYSENYHYQDSASIYIEDMSGSPIGCRFQARQDSTVFIYNGVQTLRLDNAAMTIDSESIHSARKMDNNSYLFHSFVMLEHLIPLVIANDSIQKSISDTSIGNEIFFCIRMEGAGMYFGGFHGIEHMTVPGLRRPYYLVVDKKSFLPRCLVTKFVRGDDDRDFITVRYTQVDPNPAPPPASSWSYASYAAAYKPYIAAVKRRRVEPGTIIPDFTLPVYPSRDGDDSLSLHRFAGKVILLDFWFKSCGYCMEAMPHYNALQKKFADSGFQLLTINIEDGVDDMAFFYKKLRPVYPMLFMGQKLFDSLGLNGCPSSVLLDRTGRVRLVFSGFSEEEIEKAIGAVVGK